ncbi:MAG TPA: hypothetical protein PKA06_01520, partial [Gemmatales bacterium]|nr:hypothetical protein [Gemmatales bacterium]
MLGAGILVPALGDEPVQAKLPAAGSRIVQPLVVQASYLQEKPAPSKEVEKSVADKSSKEKPILTPLVDPVAVPLTLLQGETAIPPGTAAQPPGGLVLPPNGTGQPPGGTGLPEPPKFPNIESKLPAVPPAAEAKQNKQPDIFAPRTRLNLLDSAIGSTPKPDEKTLEKYRNLVESIDDPDNTLELVVGRPRILQLKQAPVKYQAVDPSIADIELIRESKDR